MSRSNIVRLILIFVLFTACDDNPLGNQTSIAPPFNPGGDQSPPDPAPTPDPLFVPTDLANLVVWLDGNNTNTLFQAQTCSGSTADSLNDPIGCWLDLSGSSNHFIQATNKPALGNRGILFDGSNDILSNAGLNYDADSELSYFVIIQTDTQSNDGGSCCRPVISWVTNSAALYPWIGLTRNNLAPPNNLFYGWSGSGLATEATTPGDEFILSVTHDGTNKLWNTYKGGANTVPDFAIPANYSATTSLNVGGDSSNGARRFAGQILEVIFYERILPTQQRQKVEGYLACKWQIRNLLTASHPYYDAVANSTDNCPTTPQ